MAPFKPLVLLQIFLVLSVAVYGQPPGFLSLDCGKPAGYNYTDAGTGILYVSDSEYVDSRGVRQKIARSMQEAGGLPSQASDLRSFPNGSRSCYTLPVSLGNRYLVRSYFMYGDYDGKNRKPRFDVYVDVFRAGSINVSNASLYYYLELIAVATSSYMSVCLLPNGNGETFISALEMRSLPHNGYLEATPSLALISFGNLDFGAADDNRTLRYNVDAYDRLWTPFRKSGWTKLQASSEVDVSNSYAPPKAIVGTAVTPSNGSKLEFSFTPPSDDPTTPITPKYHFFMHLADFKRLSRNQSRIFNISLNGQVLYTSLEPSYLSLDTIHTITPKHYDRLEFSINQAEGSTLPPIINAMEVYIVAEPMANGTDGGDVDAIMGIKAFYNLVERNWMGDPCNPKEFLWQGLNCTYEENQLSRIVSLILSSYGLVGEISPAIGNLTQLQHLDLSGNNLTGAIPDFLANLPQLTYLNLRGNNFSGEVPKKLLDRASTGQLALSVGEVQTSRNNDVDAKGNSTWKIVAATVAAATSVAALVLALVFCVIFKRKPNQGNDWKIAQKLDFRWGSRTSQEGDSFHMPSFRAESKQFTYSELSKITNNFAKVIGRGGFGIVYYGELENGRPLAIKKLSEYSSQGPKEFQTEAQLLTRIYHKNLVPLVGYCKDRGSMLLVYEYMANGSLANHLYAEAAPEGDHGSHNSIALSWRERLRIGLEAAQGLDYLHKGCKPPIIHRDIKASNILLTDEFEAKIADFGLSRIFHNNEEQSFVSTAVMGTPGYLDPEYSNTSKLNEKSDVYSFGIVLLELITGKPAIIRKPTMMNIVNWIEPLLATVDLTQIVDLKFQGDYNPNSVWKALEVAMACVAQFSIQRPNMNDVSALLKDCLVLEQSRQKEQ